MKIERLLKHAIWSFDDETKELGITVFEETGEDEPPVIPITVKLNKTYIFSLSRFIIRAMQRMSMKKIHAKKNKEKK